jgi:hypothetical protein
MRQVKTDKFSQRLLVERRRSVYRRQRLMNGDAKRYDKLELLGRVGSIFSMCFGSRIDLEAGLVLGLRLRDFMVLCLCVVTQDSPLT